jgi:hypothetical protein
MKSVAFLKTVTTIRPTYFSHPTAYSTYDAALDAESTTIDLGANFWNWVLSPSVLRRPETTDPVLRAVADSALDELGRVRRILRDSSETLPLASDLAFCYRVLSTVIQTCPFPVPGAAIHLARGLTFDSIAQYDIAAMLEALTSPHGLRHVVMFEDLLPLQDRRAFRIAFINLRNDGELYQALLLAHILKKRDSGCQVVLDAAGGNEQFSFSDWVPAFQRHRAQLSRLIDYFIPQQDYGATSSALLSSLCNDQPASAGENLLVMNRQPGARRLNRGDLIDAFARHVNSAKAFRTAGQRTLYTRLSPDKCHWAACTFCTINSQHVTPRGSSHADAAFHRHVTNLIAKMRADHIESLILSDEALHPHLLVAFAKRILDEGLSIVYRVRCRFTNDLDFEACSLVAASGCRYIGMGLESANPRVNALFHKHMGAPIDYQAILRNLEAAGVNTHIYAILGFPTETFAEIARTRDFLVEAIRDSRYTTVSANQFYLMRGSVAARDPSSVGITAVRDRGDAALVFDWDDGQSPSVRAASRDATRAVYEEEFWPGDPDFAEGLWHLIDQSGIFYTQKTVLRENPFRRFCQAPSLQASDPAGRRYWSVVRSLDGLIVIDWLGFKFAHVQPPACDEPGAADGLTDSVLAALAEAGFVGAPNPTETLWSQREETITGQMEGR